MHADYEAAFADGIGTTTRMMPLLKSVAWMWLHLYMEKEGFSFHAEAAVCGGMTELLCKASSLFHP